MKRLIPNFQSIQKALSITLWEILLTTACITIIIVDYFLPAGSAVWVLQTLLLCLSYFSRIARLPLILAILSSIEVLSNFFISTPSDSSLGVQIRRGLGILTIVSVALIVRKAIQSRVKLESEKRLLIRANNELEGLASLAAHDLRAPIRSIFSWTEFLEMDLPKERSPQIEEALGHIKTSSKHANDLIDHILDLARIKLEPSAIREVDLNEVVSSILSGLKIQIESFNAQIIAAHLPKVYGTPSHIHSLFSNLIENAIKYRSPSRRLEIRIGFKEYGEMYQFYVQDNGIGIQSDYREKIFEKFFRLEGDSSTGTGIGLAICKKIVELKGGRIWTTSQVDVGSTFFFTLPIILKKM